MANWQFKLMLGDFYQRYDDLENPLTIPEISQKIVDEINKLILEIRSKENTIIGLRYKFEEVADELENDILPLFEEIVEFKIEDVDEFDNAMEYLYDWGDISLDGRWAGAKVCWIDTMSGSK